MPSCLEDRDIRLLFNLFTLKNFSLISFGSNAHVLASCIQSLFCGGLTFIDPLISTYFKSFCPCADSIFSRLCDLELRILNLIVQGHTNQGIADQLNVSTMVVKSNVTALYSSLDVPNRAALSYLAGKHHASLQHELRRLS